MDKLDFIRNYQEVDEWCRNARFKLKNEELLEYNYSHFTITNGYINIFTESYIWGEYSNDVYKLPLDVFYNNNLDEYIEKKLIEKKEEEEKEQKEIFEKERKSALKKIKELKVKYNI